MSIRRLVPRRLCANPAARVLVLFAMLCAGAMTFLIWRSGDMSTSSHNTLVLSGQSVASSRYRSLQSSSSHRQVPARPPTQQHAFLVLDSDESGTDTLKQLEPHLAPYREYPEAVAISLITGAAATSLAAQFSVMASDLPAVVYLPPMWQSGASFTQAATYKLGKDGAGAAGFSTWAKSKSRMTLLLMNDWDDNEICFYFVSSDDQKEVEIECPATQVELWQEVSLLDTFIARNKTGRAKLAQHVALFSGIFDVHPPGFCSFLVDHSCKTHPADEATLVIQKSSKDGTAFVLKEQPRKIKHYTPVGFEKRRAPEELFQALSGYLNASWENLVREVLPNGEQFTNQFDVLSMKATLPEIGPLKPRLFKMVQRMLEQWIGGKIPLQSTAMYGIRVYTTNNIMDMHRDRPDTHIVSAIINVAQDVDEPWPLHIFDHAGKVHSVNMQAGDVVMYEGASCAHGRVDPLKGRYFANVFVHFKPRGPPPGSNSSIHEQDNKV